MGDCGFYIPVECGSVDVQTEYWNWAKLFREKEFCPRVCLKSRHIWSPDDIRAKIVSNQGVT